MTTKAQYSVHPAAEIFPLMSKLEYAQLKANVTANGLREEIVTYQGQILDGRHRYRACIESGVEPSLRGYDGDDPVGFVVSLNLRRRHLSPGQRALVAANVATLKRGGDRSKAQNCALTHAQAAKQFGVSERLIDKASALLRAEAREHAAELVQQVRNGNMLLLTIRSGPL